MTPPSSADSERIGLERVALLERSLYPAAPRMFGLVVLIVFLGLPLLSYVGARLPNFYGYLESVGFHGSNMAGLMGIYILYLCARPERSQALGLAAAALCIEAYMFGLRPDHLRTLDRLNLIGAGFAAAGLAGMLWLALRRRGEKRNRVLGLLAVGGILVLYSGISVVFLSLLSHLSPAVFDAYVYRIESGWGTPPSFLVARYLEQHPLLDLVVSGVYLRLTLFIAIAIYLGLSFPEKTTGNLIKGFLLTMLLAFPLFVILPMVGIDDFVGSPPWPNGEYPREFAVKPVLAPPWLPRTCVPSLHASWVFLAFFAVYRIGRGAAFGGILVVLLTLLGTLSTDVGHYFIDIVVAVPMAVAVQALVTFPSPGTERLRRTLAVCGFGFVLLSSSLLRMAPDLVYNNLGLFWATMGAGAVLFLRAEFLLGHRTLHP